MVVGEYAPNTDVIGRGVMVLDQQGRRWCMLGDRWGFHRRPDGSWVHARRADPDVDPVVVTTPSTVRALEAWEAQHLGLDRDPTLPAGIARPVIVQVAW